MVLINYKPYICHIAWGKLANVQMRSIIFEGKHLRFVFQA